MDGCKCWKGGKLLVALHPLYQPQHQEKHGQEQEQQQQR